MLSKLALPAFIFLMGSISGIFLEQKIFSKPIPSCPKAPDCNCPQPKMESIDFEKVKGFKGTINLTQHYTVQVDGDSTLLKNAIDEAMRNNLSGKRRK